MKNRFFAAVAAILAGIFLLTGCASGTGTDKNAVIDVNGHTVSVADFNSYAEYYMYLYGVTSTDEENTKYIQSYVFDLLLNTKVMAAKGTEMGLNEFSDEEKATMDEDVADSLKSARESVEEEVKSDNPDATASEVELLVKKKMAEYNYTEDEIRRQAEENLICDKIYEQSTADITVSDEELKAGYDEAVAAAKASYEDGSANFEEDANDSTAAVYYVPEEARVVERILIALPEDVTSKIAELEDADDTAGAEAKRAEGLAGIKSKAEEVLASISADGSNFADIMTDKSEDTGLEEYPDGYTVLKNTAIYDDSFAEAAFALAKTGDMSGLIATADGYYIIRLKSIMAVGAVDFDSVKEDLSESLLAEKQEKTFSDLIEQWKSELKIITRPELVGLTEEDLAGEESAAEGDVAEDEPIEDDDVIVEDDDIIVGDDDAADPDAQPTDEAE